MSLQSRIAQVKEALAAGEAAEAMLASNPELETEYSGLLIHALDLVTSAYLEFTMEIGHA